LIVLLSEQCLQFQPQVHEFELNDIPDDLIVDLLILMGDPVSHPHDLAVSRYPVRNIRVQYAGAIEGDRDDLELPLDRRSQHPGRQKISSTRLGSVAGDSVDTLQTVAEPHRQLIRHGD